MARAANILSTIFDTTAVRIAVTAAHIGSQRGRRRSLDVRILVIVVGGVTTHAPRTGVLGIEIET